VFIFRGQWWWCWLCHNAGNSSYCHADGSATETQLNPPLQWCRGKPDAGDISQLILCMVKFMPWRLMESGDIASRIPNLNVRWRWVVGFTLWLLSSQGTNLWKSVDTCVLDYSYVNIGGRVNSLCYWHLICQVIRKWNELSSCTRSYWHSELHTALLTVTFWYVMPPQVMSISWYLWYNLKVMVCKCHLVKIYIRTVLLSVFLFNVIFSVSLRGSVKLHFESSCVYMLTCIYLNQVLRIKKAWIWILRNLKDLPSTFDISSLWDLHWISSGVVETITKGIFTSFSVGIVFSCTLSWKLSHRYMLHDSSPGICTIRVISCITSCPVGTDLCSRFSNWASISWKIFIGQEGKLKVLFLCIKGWQYCNQTR